MKMLPDKLEKILRDEEIRQYEVVSVNERKGRYILKCEHVTGQKICLKWNEPDKIGFNMLSKEIDVYRALHGNNFILPIVKVKDFLETEYKEGCHTIREVLMGNNKWQEYKFAIATTLQNYLQCVHALNTGEITVEESCTSNFQHLIKFLNKIVLSGPSGTKQCKFERIRNKFILRLLRTKIRKTFTDVFSREQKIIHGDFHLNNVLVDEQGVYIVDFEDIQYGELNIELAYWYVEVWMLLYGNNEKLELLEEKMREVLANPLFDKEIFHKVSELYKAGILMNRRFHLNEKPASWIIWIKQWKQFFKVMKQ